MRNALKNRKECAHVWASQSQPSGRAGNIFFEGPSIFSYGHHFEIARFMSNGAVLFNSRRYSNSTAQHQSACRSAVSHLRTFYVPSFTAHRENVESYLKDLDVERRAAVRARSAVEWRRESLNSLIDTAAEYIHYFGANVPHKLRRAVGVWVRQKEQGELFSAAELAKIKSAIAAGREANRKKEEAADAARAVRLEEAREKLNQWAAGGDVQLSYGWDELPTTLRIKDRRIETSRGAQITLRRAVELWNVLTAGNNPVGMELDNFTVNKWDGAILTVGCHEISAAELHRVAAVLNLPGALPAAAQNQTLEVK